MIDLQDVFEIHQVLIQEFGGSNGVRDEGLLKSAIERSSYFLIEKSKKVFTEKLQEGETQMAENGYYPRTVRFYGSLQNNYEFSDSLFETNNYKWSVLKEYLRDSSYEYILSNEMKDLLNYENQNFLLFHNLHKTTLFRTHNQAQIREFSRISYCNFIVFDKFSSVL